MMKYGVMMITAATLAACAGAPEPLCDRSRLATEPYASHVDAYCEARPAAGWKPDGGYADEGDVGRGAGPDAGSDDPTGAVGVPDAGPVGGEPDAPDAGPDSPVGEDGPGDEGPGDEGPGDEGPGDEGPGDEGPGKGDGHGHGHGGHGGHGKGDGPGKGGGQGHGHDKD